MDFDLATTRLEIHTAATTLISLPLQFDKRLSSQSPGLSYTRMKQGLSSDQIRQVQYPNATIGAGNGKLQQAWRETAPGDRHY